MASILKKAGLGLALAATTLVAAAPAEAQRYGDRFRRDRGGDVAVAGLAGLAIGAAIASNNNRFNGPGFYGPRRGFYNRGFYGPDFYGPRRGFYGPRRGFYGPGYGGGYGFRGGFGPRCFIDRQWDPYYGVPVNVRICR